jgi:hypothetical protein
MKYQLYHSPILLDYLRVISRAPEDQKLHFTEVTGQEWNIDSIAVGNLETTGPKWSIYADDTPIVVGGFAQRRPGVFEDWFISTPEAFSQEHYRYVTRLCKGLMDNMLGQKIAHRLECVVPVARLERSPRLAKWYKVLGYNREALHHGYCANGGDAVRFARVKH